MSRRNRAINIKYFDKLILIFLSIHIICSQLYIAVSSIGLGVAIILTIIRIYYSNEIYKPDTKLIYIFIFFIISILISSALSDNPLESLYLSKRIFLFAGFFIAIIFFSNITQLKYFIIALLVFTAIISLIELAIYFTKLQTVDTPISELRIEQFGYPITNGEIKMLIILIFLPLIFSKLSFPLGKLWIILALIPIIISFFFTNARSAFTGLTAGILLLGILKYRTLLFSFIIVIILFVLLAPASFKSRTFSIFDFEHPSNKSRFTMWSVGLKMISERPLFGYGDTDTKIHYEKFKKIEIHGEGSHMHNNFLQLMISYGIVGFLVWLMLMIYIIVRQIQIYVGMSDDLLKTFTLISLASMTAMQISGLTEYNFGDFEFAAVLWFTLSLAFITAKLSGLSKINLANEQT